MPVKIEPMAAKSVFDPPAYSQGIKVTGAETIVLLRLGGEPAQARISPDIRPTPGAPASFALDTRRLCLFDPETERLIA